MWMRKKCRVSEAERIIEETDFDDVPDDTAELQGGLQIVISGYYLLIPVLKIQLHEGLICVFDKEANMYMPDEAVTVIIAVTGQEAESICYKQDGIIGTLYDWGQGKMSLDKIENLWCEIIVPD